MEQMITGLDKFGLDEQIIGSILSGDNKAGKKKEVVAPKAGSEPVEEDFLFLKSVSCPVCDNVFSTLVVKSGKARRLEPDFDLRPRFKYIDTNKYDITFCTKCGYAALNKEFIHLSLGQKKLIREHVCKNFKAAPELLSDNLMDYDTAIDHYKVALYNTIVKRGRVSEKGYECLKIAWLYRGKAESIRDGVLLVEDPKRTIIFCLQEERRFYGYAYDALVEAMAKESFPICGMDGNTYQLLLATMGYKLNKLEEASKMVSSLIISRTVSSNIKNRALDVKEMILAKLREQANKSNK